MRDVNNGWLGAECSDAPGQQKAGASLRSAPSHPSPIRETSKSEKAHIFDFDIVPGPGISAIIEEPTGLVWAVSPALDERIVSMSRCLATVVMVALCVSAFSAAAAFACPFCSALSQTLSEEMASMDVVVIARLKQPPPPFKEGADSDPSSRVATAKFEIVTPLKGAEILAGQKVIETVYFGEGKKGEAFLITGVDPPKLMWSTPLPLTERAQEYLPKLVTLPKEGADRLEFFQDYLEDADEMLARDAYDEFAKAPYKAVKRLKDQMNHDQLVAWIQHPDIPASRRRLYLTMLGVCGSKADLPMLEELLTSEDRQAKAGLDAMIACYITLKGEDGLPLIEELFLANKDAEYADTYAAIMAIRFHGTETDVVPQKRLVKSLRSHARPAATGRPGDSRSGPLGRLGIDAPAG